MSSLKKVSSVNDKIDERGGCLMVELYLPLWNLKTKMHVMLNVQLIPE